MQNKHLAQVRCRLLMFARFACVLIWSVWCVTTSIDSSDSSSDEEGSLGSGHQGAAAFKFAAAMFAVRLTRMLKVGKLIKN